MSFNMEKNSQAFSRILSPPCDANSCCSKATARGRINRLDQCCTFVRVASLSHCRGLHSGSEVVIVVVAVATTVSLPLVGCSVIVAATSATPLTTTTTTAATTEQHSTGGDFSCTVGSRGGSVIVHLLSLRAANCPLCLQAATYRSSPVARSCWWWCSFVFLLSVSSVSFSVWAIT